MVTRLDAAYSTDMLAVTAWVKQTPGTNGFILTKSIFNADVRAYSLYSSGDTNAVVVEYTTQTSMGAALTDGARHASITFNLVRPLDDDEWHFVSFVFDFPSASLAVDGTAVAVTAVFDPVAATSHSLPLRYALTTSMSNSVLFIGARFGTPTANHFFFSGSLRDVLVAHTDPSLATVQCQQTCQEVLYVAMPDVVPDGVVVEYMRSSSVLSITVRVSVGRRDVSV